MDGDTLAGLLGGLEAMGLVPQDEQQPFGLWADAGEASSTALSLDLLRLLGQANAGLALALHREALARWLLRRTGLPAPAGGIALTVTGHYGLARASLGAWLRAGALDADDGQLLADWLDRHGRQSLVCAAPGCRQLLWPVWNSAAIQWRLSAAEHLDAQIQIAHGLDELEFRLVSQPAGAPAIDSDLAPQRARALYADALKQEWLGLAAIGLGALEHGEALAREYSEVRSQGGRRIGEHPAVRIMLGEIRSAIRQSQLCLRGMRGRAIEALALADVASLRLAACEQLVHACHQVIQVHGGLGYMRDAGPEKLMRDQNMLRLAAGGVFGLPLFIQGVES